jgi:DNA-binding response OmpR family regulator/predicted regulator of Ras-like GTPase activity (Roadblock/LC7/MglB family)
MGKGRARYSSDTLAVATMAEQWRILVVENEEDLNWNIVNSLQKDGYIVLGVTSGGEAIRTLWSEEYDVVICSQQMPDADGFDLLQWMRTYCPNARMVMLGTPGSGVSRAQALGMGVTSYLEKPLDVRALKEELRGLLHSTGFSASLDSFDLLDVIQIINMSRKSIALVVNTGLEEQGTLRFQVGELIWAEYGTLRGEEAFFALAAHKNGTVVHRPWSEQIMPNVTQPLSRLIFQALQYRSKYAEQQPLSSEIEAVRPGYTVPDPPTLPLLPETLQDMEEDDSPFQFLEEDDSPFQFVAEEVPVERSPVNSPFEQVGTGGGLGIVKNTESGVTNQPGTKDKAWWEPTGRIPAFQMSGSMRALTTEEAGQAKPANGSMNAGSSPAQKTGMSQTNALPSWLTDQPTHMSLPVMRGNTSQMPAVPQERSPVPPKTPPIAAPISPPASPGPSPQRNAEWPVLPQMPLNPSDSGLRRVKQEEITFTNSHRAIKPNNAMQSNGATRPASAEWQVPMSLPLQGQTGQMSPVKPSGPVERSGDTLQSLKALKKTNAASAPVADPRSAPTSPVPVQPVPAINERAWSAPVSGALNNGLPETGMPKKSTQGKWNYPALSAALQTLGYSVPGFVAAAVVNTDGTPIAQVAVDEGDISPLCAHLSSVMQGVLQAVELNRGEYYEHTVITSRSQHILLRLIGKQKTIFQALITMRETDPTTSLDVMANVDAALAAAFA